MVENGTKTEQSDGCLGSQANFLTLYSQRGNQLLELHHELSENLGVRLRTARFAGSQKATPVPHSSI